MFLAYEGTEFQIVLGQALAAVHKAEAMVVSIWEH